MGWYPINPGDKGHDFKGGRVKEQLANPRRRGSVDPELSHPGSGNLKDRFGMQPKGRFTSGQSGVSWRAGGYHSDREISSPFDVHETIYRV